MSAKNENKRDILWWLPRVISLGALLLAIVHIIFPNLSIDAITLTLIIIAILPWLTPLVKAMELPGGWKIEFRDLEKTTFRAEAAGLLADSDDEGRTNHEYSFEIVANTDPNLALAGLRIEIEKRLNLLGKANNLSEGKPKGVGLLLRYLGRRGVLKDDEIEILADLVNMLNAAVHGADVDKRSAEWAVTIGPRLLRSLDERIDDNT
jgi:hypothetical protein